MSTRVLHASSSVGLISMIGGLLIWAACFVVLYVALSIGCEAAAASPAAASSAAASSAAASLAATPPAAASPSAPTAGRGGLGAVLILLWLVHLLGLLALLRHACRRARQPEHLRSSPQTFVLELSVMLNAVALGATVWTGFPVLLLQPCV